MFGGGETQAQTQTVASGVDIQSSCYGGVVPVIYGRTRLTGNLLWYGDFQALPVQSSGGNGGKGGDSGQGTNTYDYKASFIFALGEGTLSDVQNVWASKTKTAFADSKLSFFNGDLAQAPWGYLGSKHSDKALSYSGTGYVAAMAYDLGQSAQMPNLSYEVTGIGSGAIGTPDADPAAVVQDVLTNPRYGIGFPTARLPAAGFTLFSNYCLGSGLVISAVFDTQSDAASQLNGIVQSCNSEFVWSGTALTIVPYGDQSVGTDPHKYDPPAAPLFSLTDDDFLQDNGQDPVQCSRTRPSDQMNSIRFEFLDRSHDYNGSIVEAKNQAAIEAYGLRGEQPEQMHHFCDANAAKLAATLKLQRQSVRNVYSFTLGWRYCLLDPMDIVEITDSGLGLDRQWVRILSLEEDDSGNIRVTAEEYLGGTGHAPLYDFEPGSPYSADYNADPGNVTDTLIFEPPPAMLAASGLSAPQIMVGACGGPNWGGCEVHLSLDNSTYKRIGKIVAPARIGRLSAALANGGDPDTTHTLSVDLTESGGVLGAATQPDADSLRTLCYVDGELLAYENRTLTGTNRYDLTYLRRGAYGSTAAGHAAGTLFCRLDEAVKSFDLPVTPVSYIGKTLYLKFLSFNIYGGALQDISGVSPIAYNPNGTGTFVAPPADVTFSVGTEQQGDGSWISFGIVAWTASPDPFFDMYDVQYRLHTGPGPWQSRRVGSDTTSIRISPLAPRTAYDVQVRAVRTKGPFYSAWDQALNITSVVKTDPPAPPTAIHCTGGYKQILVQWTASTDNDVAWYEVSSSGSNVLSSASVIARVNATSYADSGLGLSDTRFYWVRAQDTSGNFSAYLGSGTATSKAVTSSDLTGKIIGSQIDNATITGANLANSIIDISKIAGGYGLPAFWTGAALPGPANALSVNGSIILWSHDGRLYRYSNIASGWVLAVDGGDLSAGSVTTDTIDAGSITTALLAADAVTAEKLFIGDTTNLVLDDMFQDPTYWVLRNAGASPVIVSYQAPSAGPPPNATFKMGAAAAIQIAVGNIPANAGANYGAVTPLIPIKQGMSYRASCNAAASGSGVNKNGQLYLIWYDGTKTVIGASVGAEGPQSGGAYAPTDTGEDGNLFDSAGGSIITNIATAPAGACYVQLFPCVPSTNPSAAGSGTAWWFTHIRLERQSVGTLIEDGAITTGHIVAAGIDGAAITAGTITGDRIDANFIDSEVFATVHNPGQPFIEISGNPHTVTSHMNAPWFRVNDGTFNRVIIGQLQDAWGLWIRDAAGNLIFEESTLGTSVVSTGNVVQGSIVGAATASVANGPFGTGAWQTAASLSVTLYDNAVTYVDATVLLGYSAGPQTWGVRIKVDGTVQQTIQTGIPQADVSVGISWSGALTGSSAGTSHTVVLEWNASSSVQIDGGTLTAIGMQR